MHKIEHIRSASRVCFFAHYHAHGIVAPHVLHYLEELQILGFSTVVLSTADLNQSEQAKFYPYVTAVIMRENRGLDFGGWIDAHNMFSPLRAEFLLLANDSVYAPIGDLNHFFKSLTSVYADFYGAVESFEDRRHLQSWFILLRPRAYQSAAYRLLMSSPMPNNLSKPEIIERYEIGLTVNLARSGLSYHAAYSPDRSGWLARNRPFNSSHLLWRQLITDGIPFLKVELLRDNPVRMRDIDDWRKLVLELAPSLVPLIDDDIRKRRSFNSEQRWSREHWYWSLYVPKSSYWPETRRMIVRDHHLEGEIRSILNRLGFFGLEIFGSRVRPWIKRLVNWRDDRRSRAVEHKR